MILLMDGVLALEELDSLKGLLERVVPVDGKTTAGWYAKSVKNNLQLDRDAPETQEAQEFVSQAFARNALFQAAVNPKKIHTILFSRYDRGMSYGTHVDNAFMGKEAFWRADVSFTLFLSPPDSYEGGELVIEEGDGERSYKLEAGSAIVYPSSSLHRVETVTAGTRWAAVGWVQSLLRDPRDRELLFDLDTVRRSIFAKEGKTLEFDLISKTYSNLLRRWAE
ncbi:Fe2+-dependent dioxygenase [Oscillatoria sp. FACHB-1406]|uniref:Fe2+-dependent dioxygenase n=1 Tax=Oscillatoria sp. FACHB-1406 TaxID=2692846 RepID=UPI001682FD29|nr:Fe2+-dependent dioxygenase [Oscillatoria sp. FACHB-1406]MBD2578169.1 Fe2+-dependent dioxygenase [Oscillatoria sp. FACHB-1406]